MKTSWTRGVVAVVVVLTVAAIGFAEVKVKKTRANLIGKRVPGSWVLDEELTKRMGLENAKMKAIELVADEAVLAPTSFPEGLEKVLRKNFGGGEPQIFVAGKATVTKADAAKDEFNFLVISHDDVLWILGWSEGKRGIDDWLALVPGTTEDKDLLFITDEHPEKGTHVFKRATK